jgi:hypothetical protein
MQERMSLIDRLGPPVYPFERKKEQHIGIMPGDCKDFSESTEDKSSNGSPVINLELIDDECINVWKLPENKKYLWIIDEIGNKLRLRFIPEVVENKERKHKPIVCHSNITACGKALQGGECWWCEETKTLYINPKSGRYGAETIEQWEAVKEFFIEIGYTKLVDIKPAPWKLKTV